MLFPSLRRNPQIFNQKLHDYCLNSTYESIKKKLAKNDEERKTIIKVNLVTDITNPNPNPNNPFLPVLFFLSISSLLYYFYNSKK
jgi:hypothetical protein